MTEKDVLAYRVQTLEDSVGSMRDAILKLVAIEERQVAIRAEIASLIDLIKGSRDAVQALEQKTIKLDSRLRMVERVSGWVTGAVVAGCGIVVTFVLRKVGLA